MNLSREVIAFAIFAGIATGIFIDASLTQPSIIEHVNAAEPEPEPVEVRLVVRINWTRDRLEQELKTVANKYNVSYERMYKTIECESGFNIDIQSGHTLNYGREESWGIAQFHLPSKNRTADGKVITKEMALDPAIALDAMAFHFSQGNAKAWTCYRKLYMR